ncbi:unnamed protein product, partial [Mesorhabditis belari]|uniref:BRCT domain-containing protein n=1 Tax=Mesorhabditis belari TaxID=2138241 RepID=A0AAF3EU32_9BILA
MPQRTRRSAPRVGYDFPDLSISSIQGSSDSESRVIDYLDESSFINELSLLRENEMQQKFSQHVLRRSSKSPFTSRISKYSSRSNVIAEIDEEESSSPISKRTFEIDEEQSTSSMPRRTSFTARTLDITNVFGDVSTSDDCEIICEEADSAEMRRQVLQPITSFNNVTLPFLQDVSSIVPPTRDQSLEMFDKSSLDDENEQRSLSHINCTPLNERSAFVDSSDKAFGELCSDVDSLVSSNVCHRKNRLPPYRKDFLELSTNNPKTLILRGCRVFVELHCCTEYAARLRKLVRDMGGQLASSLQSQVTHVVFGCGGDNQVIAMGIHLGLEIVAPSWIEDSFADGYRRDEKPYSISAIVDGPTRDKIRHSVSFLNHEHNSQEPEVIDLSPDANEQARVALSVQPRRSSAESELQRIFDQSSPALQKLERSMNASELLALIGKLNLQQRLDQLLRCDSHGHGARCCSRLLPQGVSSLNSSHQSENHDLFEHQNASPAHNSFMRKDIDNVQKGQFSKPAPKKGKVPVKRGPKYVRPRETVVASQVGRIFVDREVKRRRSIGGFSLQFRDSQSLAAKQQQANLNEKLAVSGLLKVTEQKPKNVPMQKKSRNRKRAPPRRDSSPIAHLSQALSGIAISNDQRKSNSLNVGRTQSFIRFRNKLRLRGKQNNVRRPRLSINSNLTGNQSSAELCDRPRLTPLIDTASSFINRVLGTSSSEEFVSPLAQRAKATKIVFTGLANKRQEAALKPLLDTIGLSFSKSVTRETRCVISGSGARTLAVLQAVVDEIPIVTPKWLEDSAALGKLVNYRKYVYEDWEDLVEYRRRDLVSGVCKLLRPLGSIFVHDKCTKPLAADLRVLIRKSGGIIVTLIDKADLIVCPEEVVPPRPPPQTQPLVTLVNEKYILDCITRNEVLFFGGYSRPLPDASFLSSDVDNGDGDGELFSD